MRTTIALITLLITLGISNLHAQNATLTKEETVNYLNKKLNETIGHYITIDYGGSIGKKTFYYWGASVKMQGDKVVITRDRGTTKERQEGQRFWEPGHGTLFSFPCGYITLDDESSFNPAHILKIEPGTTPVEGEPVGSIKITLKSNLGIYKMDVGSPGNNIIDTSSDNYGKCVNFRTETQSNSVEVLYFSYLKADDTNFNKIKKALEYLRDLVKAEDDPFGE